MFSPIKSDSINKQLPNEILTVVFSFLSPGEVAKTERVCTSWKKLNFRRQLACLMSQGRVQFYEDTLGHYGGVLLRSDPHRWGNGAPEPFVCIRVFSPISTPVNDYERRSRRRCWTDRPPPGMEPLPHFLPLRLFINKDGSFKDSGEKIQIEWKGKKVALTCSHELSRSDDRAITTFKQATERHIKMVFSSRKIGITDLALSIARAVFAKEWISSE